VSKYTQLHDSITKNIEKHGWNIIFVFSPEGEEGIAYAYTIGMRQTCDHPDLILSGLPYETAGIILNHIGKDIKEGLQLTHGEELPGYLGDNYKIKVVKVDVLKYQQVILQCMNYYEDRDVDPRDIEFFQIVWPDKDGEYDTTHPKLQDLFM